MIFLKIYPIQDGFLLAGCDADIIGKKFCEGKLKIEISREFYCGEEVDENTFLNQLKNCTIVNLVGKKVIKLAIKHGFIDKKCVIKIKGVPHAQYLRMKE